MVDADIADLYLEVWARWIVSDRAGIRSLWYPAATPEHRYARRGGAAAPHALLAPEMDGVEMAEQVDGLMAQLKLHNIYWYDGLSARYTTEGPDEMRAQRLGLKLAVFRACVYAGKRWVRQRL